MLVLILGYHSLYSLSRFRLSGKRPDHAVETSRLTCTVGLPRFIRTNVNGSVDVYFSRGFTISFHMIVTQSTYLHITKCNVMSKNLNVDMDFIHVAAAASFNVATTSTNHSRSDKKDDSCLVDHFPASATNTLPPDAGRRKVGTLNRSTNGEYKFLYNHNCSCFDTFEQGIGFAQTLLYTRMKDQDEEQWVAYLSNDRKSGPCNDELVMVFETK